MLTKTDEKVPNSEEENIITHSSMRTGVGNSAIAETRRATVWIRRPMSTDAVCHWVILHQWGTPKD